MTHRTEPGFDQTIDHEGQMEAQHRFAELGGLERLAIQQRSVLHITPLWATSRLHNILKRVLPPDLTYSSHEKWSLRDHYVSGPYLGPARHAWHPEGVDRADISQGPFRYRLRLRSRCSAAGSWPSRAGLS